LLLFLVLKQYRLNNCEISQLQISFKNELIEKTADVDLGGNI